MYRILIVEDDTTIATVIADELSGWGYETRVASDFGDAMQEFRQTNPHLVLLDLVLPQRSGFYWCAEIRRISRAPIVFITSAADSMNLVTALHQGADDFIAKPFDLQVLVAKVQALLRRSYDFSATPPLLSHRGAALDKEAAALLFEGRKIELTRNELFILIILMEHKGRVVTREALMRRLWDDENFIDDNTLTVNMSRLRSKLEEAGLCDFIVTKKGLGYCLA